MSKRPFSWQDRFPDRVTCLRCLEVKDKTDLDRLLWCVECRAQAKSRASLIGWIGGGLIAAFVGTYIWISVRPTTLIPQLWLAVALAVAWLSARFVKEIAYGAMRFRNARAAEAVPPTLTSDPDGPTEADA